MLLLTEPFLCPNFSSSDEPLRSSSFFISGVTFTWLFLGETSWSSKWWANYEMSINSYLHNSHVYNTYCDDT